MAIKIISFDMDGTLLNSEFDTLVWDVLIPQVYAKQKGILVSEAQKFFAEEYMKDLSELNIESNEWYDVKWWIEKYELNTSWEELWQKAQHTIYFFDDVKETLTELKKMGFKLIITTGASQKFIDVKLRNSKLAKMFDEIISVSSKYNKHSKDSGVYEDICATHNVKPLEFLHVGDSYIQDYQAPREIGCQALFLNRRKNSEDLGMISTLKQVIDYVRHVNEIKF